MILNSQDLTPDTAVFNVFLLKCHSLLADGGQPDIRQTESQSDWRLTLTYSTVRKIHVEKK